MVELIAQEENDKKRREGGKEEGNCNQHMQKPTQHAWKWAQLRLHTVQVVPAGALSDGVSHVVNKDGKNSSTEVRCHATKVVSARRRTSPPPAGLQAAPSPSASSDVV